MRIFINNPDSWGKKVNFADQNNVVVGFDMTANCCEQFGWALKDGAGGVIASDETKALDGVNLRLSLHDFDPDFFRDDSKNDSDVDGCVVFKLRAPDGDVVYLELFNSHNGYYSHGFSMQHGERMIRYGSL